MDEIDGGLEADEGFKPILKVPFIIACLKHKNSTSLSWTWPIHLHSF